MCGYIKLGLSGLCSTILALTFNEEALPDLPLRIATVTAVLLEVDPCSWSKIMEAKGTLKSTTTASNFWYFTKSKASVSTECLTEIPNVLITSVIKLVSAESRHTNNTDIDNDDSVITSTQSYTLWTANHPVLVGRIPKVVYFGRLISECWHF